MGTQVLTGLAIHVEAFLSRLLMASCTVGTVAIIGDDLPPGLHLFGPELADRITTQSGGIDDFPDSLNVSDHAPLLIEMDEG